MARLLVAGLMCAALLAEPAVARDNYEGIVWLEQPDGREFRSNYPEHAAAQSVEGFSTIDCFVLLDGTPDCRVIAEAPAGWGFGNAALAISRSFQVRPARIDGQPVATGRLRRTLRFVLPEDAAPPEDMPPEVQAYIEATPTPDLPIWDEAPTAAVVSSVTPPALRERRQEARAVLSCHIADGRRLRCEPLFESPVGSNVLEAALGLAPQFRIAERETEFLARFADEPFLLPLSFGSVPELTPVNRVFAGVGPLALPRGYATAAIFPPRALAARVRGVVTALCTLNETSSLACILESETPTEWGFGEAVLETLRDFPPAPAGSGFIRGDQLRFTIDFHPDIARD